MRKTLLLISVLFLALMANATGPAITIDGDKSDWSEVPMLSEPGAWPMLKVLPAADAELGTNALVYMMENKDDFDSEWAQYPTAFIDKDYDVATHPVSCWQYTAMGVDYKATTGAQVGDKWVVFPKAMSANNKVIEIGFPMTYIADLESKFGFAMYYNSGQWYCPDYDDSAHPEIKDKNGFLYKTRSYTTLPGTVSAANAFAHPTMGECIDYVDFGMRDNGNDTIRWAAFPINLTQPAVYDVTTNVTSTLGWKFEFWLVDAASNAIVAHIPAPENNVSSSKTSFTFGSLDLRDVPIGKYMLKVKNRTPYSTVKLSSIDLTYAGGYVVDVPGTLGIVDAVIAGGKREDGVIKFDDATTGTAEWKVAVASGAYFDVSTTIKNQYGHNITIAVYEEDGVTPVGSVTEGKSEYSANTEGHTLDLGGIYLKAGNYVVKYSNATSGSDAKLVNVGFTYVGGHVQNMPGTTTLADAWFSSNGTRADGKITYTHVSDGCWAKWNINIVAAATYNVTVNIQNEYGHNYTVEFLKEGTSTPVSVTEGTTTYGKDATLYPVEVGAIALEAGNYVITVSNAIGDAALLSVKLEYAGGGMVNLPNTLLPADATFSANASIKDGMIDFKPSETSSSEWAKWNIHSDGGFYTFTVNAYNRTQDVGQTYSIKVYDSTDEEHPLIDETSPRTEDEGDYSYTTDKTEIPQGDYIVKVQNGTNWSVGRVVNIEPSYFGGALVDIPGTIQLKDASLSSNAYRNAAETELHFIAPGDEEFIANEWAKWNVHVESEGAYEFTLTVGGTNYGVYTLTVNGTSVSKGKSGAGSVTLPPVFLTQGNHVIQLANTNNYADGYLTGVSCATASSVLVLDEMDENMDVINNNTGAHVAALRRTFRTGVYNSICLPFNVNNSSELTNIFGEGYELIGLNSATLEGGVLTLNFATPENNIEYGRPYLIKPTKDVINPIFESHTISKSTSHLTVHTDVVDLVGVLYKQDLGTHPENLYLGADGKLYFSNNDVTIYGFRAYFHVNVSNPQHVIKQARIVTSGQVATYIDLVGNDDVKDALKTIENGQLVIIRDGIRYNVCGQRIE